MMHVVRAWSTGLMALVAFAAPIGAQTSSPTACGPLPPPRVVVDEPNARLQYWLIEDGSWFHHSTLPTSGALRDFRERISARHDTDPRALLERQLPRVSGGDADNVRLVLGGDAGTLRTMSCLEGLLLATQAERSADQGRSMYTHPTEFLGYVLRRGAVTKIWFYTVDQPGLGGLTRMHDPLFEDLGAGWVVERNIHNHNFFPEAETLLGGVVPSATDIQYARNMRGPLGLSLAVITNGFHSLEMTAADFDVFVGP